MRNGAESVTMQGRHVLAIDDGNAYLAAGLAGLGVLWLPDYMAKAHVGKANWSSFSKTGASTRCHST